MAAPELTYTGKRLYAALAPIAGADAEHDYALARYVAALAALVDELADLSRDTDEAEGWEALFDVDTIDAKYLPYVGQFLGVDVPDRLDEASKRLRIHETGGFQRGTPDAVKGAARQFLTGSRTVYLTERHGSAWRLTVATLASETPDPAAVQRALAEQVPAGIVWTHSVIPGGSFDSLRDTHSDFAHVTTAYATFDELRANPTA